jgi:hypothetical protein
MQSALAQWHAPRAAEQIAETMLETAGIQIQVERRAGVGKVASGRAEAPGDSGGQKTERSPGPKFQSGNKLRAAVLCPSTANLLPGQRSSA